MLIVKKFSFEAAHNLVNYAGKCENVHGHSYKLIVKLKGEQTESGMIIDFEDIKNIVNEHIIKILDHSNLNDLVVQPTVENIAIWIWDNLKNRFDNLNARLYEIEVWETETTGVIYQGS